MLEDALSFEDIFLIMKVFFLYYEYTFSFYMKMYSCLFELLYCSDNDPYIILAQITATRQV